VPSRDEVVQVWGDGLLASLPSRARARFRVGRFLDVVDGSAVFALPNETHRSYCEEVRLDVEVALGSHFGTAVPIRLVVDADADAPPTAGPLAATVATPAPPSTAAPAGTRRARPAATTAAARDAGAAPVPEAPPSPADVRGGDDPDLLDPDVLAAETEPAGAGLTPQERVKQAFPGAHEV
jgi:hypothetical protein